MICTPKGFISRKMKCPYCSSDMKNISFFKCECPKCGRNWAITEITNTNRMYYNE